MGGANEGRGGGFDIVPWLPQNEATQDSSTPSPRRLAGPNWPRQPRLLNPERGPKNRCLVGKRIKQWHWWCHGQWTHSRPLSTGLGTRRATNRAGVTRSDSRMRGRKIIDSNTDEEFNMAHANPGGRQHPRHCRRSGVTCGACWPSGPAPVAGVALPPSRFTSIPPKPNVVVLATRGGEDRVAQVWLAHAGA